MSPCLCGRPVADFYVGKNDDGLTVVVIHEDSVCEWPDDGVGEPILRAILRDPTRGTR